MVRANPTRRDQHINKRNVQARRQEAARHPRCQMAHPALEQSRTQKLAGTRREEHHRALHQTATVQEREPGTRHRRRQRQHPAGVQRLRRIDTVQLGVRLRRSNLFRKLRNELTQLIQLMSVNAHRALLSHLSTEITVSVRRSRNFGEGHLRVMLLQPHSLRQTRHRRLNTVCARTRLHQDAAQAEHHLRLRHQVLMSQTGRPQINTARISVRVRLGSAGLIIHERPSGSCYSRAIRVGMVPYLA